jgi:malate dehydrogenase (oxaloacetate-decarboxylating)
MPKSKPDLSRPRKRTGKKAKKQSLSQEALLIHRELRGKIAVRPKAALTQDNLRLFYTPGVGMVSLYLADKPEHTGRYTMRGNSVAVISDGSAVLGLGNIGPEGAYPVMEGKAMLFGALAGIDAVPILLDTQDEEAVIETVKHIAPSFGGINLEDIAAPRCFVIEEALKRSLDIPVFHDDQHGTAMVVLAGLINALKVAGKRASRVRVVVSGAGAAGQSITRLLFQFGIKHIILVDSRGILSRRRRDLSPSKRAMLRCTNPEGLEGGLKEALSGADVFIGVSRGNLLDRHDIRTMAENPIVFGLSNPNPEIMPDEAASGGALVVATGRSDFPNQVNNALGFPGIFRGALDHRVREITDTMLIRAAKNLAALIKEPRADCIIPGVFDERVVPAVARAIR